MSPTTTEQHQRQPSGSRAELANGSFRLERTVKIGDLLTSLSILISLAAVLVTWSRDATLRQRQQADEIRKAAATTLAKLERWQELSSAIFQESQPVFVTVSQNLGKNHDAASARDYLWRELNS